MDNNNAAILAAVLANLNNNNIGPPIIRPPIIPPPVPLNMRDRFNARKQIRDQIETLNNRIGRDYVNHFDTDIAEINRLFIAIENDEAQSQEEKNKLTGLIAAASRPNVSITTIPVDQFKSFTYFKDRQLKVGGYDQELAGGAKETILKSSISIKLEQNTIVYSPESDVMNVIDPNTFDFTRRPHWVNSPIWFIAAFIYNPYLDCFHLKIDQSGKIIKPLQTDGVQPRFFLDFEYNSFRFENTQNNNITLRDSLFSDRYIDEIIQTFYPNDANKKPRVMSLFSNLLTKTADTFYAETRGLVATAVPEGYNENKYTVQKTIGPSFGLPYLVMGKLVGKTITFYPKIPPYLFLLDKMGFNKEMVRLDKQKKEEDLARQRALIASVVAINEVEQQRQVLAEEQALADRLAVEVLAEAERLRAVEVLAEAERLRAAQVLAEQQQKALVASVIAINEVERQAAQVAEERLEVERLRLAAEERERVEERERLAAEERLRLAAEERLRLEEEERLRLEEEERERLAAEERERLEADRVRAARVLEEQQQKALVASVIAINEVEKQRDALAQASALEKARVLEEERLAAQVLADGLAAERLRTAQVLEEQQQKDLVASVIAVNKLERQ
jgi:hypothetical protein